MTTINPEKLALLDAIHLDDGAHGSFDEGHCAMEVVAWLADLGHTDAPSCASPVLTRCTIQLNDRWDHERRQALKPYLPRMVGTAGDGKDALRERVATKSVAELVAPWLRLAGLDDEADQVAALDGSDMLRVRQVLRQAGDAAWAIRRKRYDLIREKVRERLAEKHAAADAAAAAVAVADADAAAAADADAVADAAAVAVADAAAVADAVAAAGGDDYWTQRSAAYKAARAYYEANPLPIAQDVADLAASQQGAALDLLERLIDPQE